MKILIAKLEKGIVKIQQDDEFIPADDVEFLCDGKAESQGVVIIDGIKKRYITNTQIDLTFTLDQLIEILDQITAITTNKTFVIGATAAVFGPITDFAKITTKIKSIKKEIKEHLIT